MSNSSEFQADMTPVLPSTPVESRRAMTATRADLADAVYRKVGLSRAESAAIVELVLEEICDAITHQGTVKLSSFGTFRLRSKGTRIGRNPKTGIEVPIAPRRVVVFRPSNVMKAIVNGQDPNKARD